MEAPVILMSCFFPVPLSVATTDRMPGRSQGQRSGWKWRARVGVGEESSRGAALEGWRLGSGPKHTTLPEVIGAARPVGSKARKQASPGAALTVGVDVEADLNLRHAAGGGGDAVQAEGACVEGGSGRQARQQGSAAAWSCSCRAPATQTTFQFEAEEHT